jgi:hypothetical protein
MEGNKLDKIKIKISISFGKQINNHHIFWFFGHGCDYANRKGGTLPIQHHLGEHKWAEPKNKNRKLEVKTMAKTNIDFLK